METECPVFDANTVVIASLVDGVDLDADQHGPLGPALATTFADRLDNAEGWC